jgi:hypothetical protein
LCILATAAALRACARKLQRLACSRAGELSYSKQGAIQHQVAAAIAAAAAAVDVSRRDLGVLLLHAGQPAAAAAELAAYLDSARSVAGPRFGRSAAAAADPFDVRLAEQLWKILVLDSGIVPAR